MCVGFLRIWSLGNCLLVNRGASLGWPKKPTLMGSQTSTQTGVELGRQDLVQKQVGMAWLAAEVPLVPWIVWESAWWPPVSWS